MTQNGKDFDITPRTTTTTTRTAARSTTSSSSSTSIYTEPGVFCDERDLEAIKGAYKSCICDEIKASVAYYIENLLQWGMTAEVICNAIQETGWARRPSPNYMRAILERYRAHGIKTMAQLLHDQDEFCERKKWFEG